MKIVRFDGDRVGLVEGEDIVDFTNDVGGEGAWPPVGMLRFIRSFATLTKDGRTRARKPLSAARLEAPVVWPNKLLAFPVNYLAHGEEMASVNRANLNGFFLKANSSISGPNDPIILPDVPDPVHHECELAVIIGREGRHISAADAMDYVFGYSCLIDVTVRNKRERVMRKSYDTFAPIGPWIVTADEIADPQDIEMKLWVNDELRQSANTRDMIVNVREMIETCSSACTLQPGDIIATGTPEGVGPIVRGDTVRIEIAGVGGMAIPVR
jgi:2-keto-4-pentenoate hydratase/2-oxohepta-3-ene-1,7-dioic acid hydratase in catechol pathway